MKKENKIKQKSHIAFHTSKNSGITLIALIITIIVLLILAVVTIRAVQGDEIIQHAKNASKETKIAQEKEQIQLAVNEWKIQKNYQNEPGNFKSFMVEKISNVDSVDGPEAGPLTVTMKGTGNIYTVKEDGTITGPIQNGGGSNPISPEDLDYVETYFMGSKNETTGERPKNIDINSLFTDELLTLSDTNIKFGGLPYELEGDGEKEMYVRYHQTPYKLILNALNDLWCTTSVTALETEGREGQYVSYNGITWIILYDDATNGLQMISAEALQYNGAYFALGYDDSLIDWDSWTDEQKKEVDFDENGELNNFEKSVYSYNNAITTLNTACESFVQQSDITSGKITNVRCVGSNPTDKNSENATLYESDNLKIWPIDNENFKVGIGNKKGKSTDNNYGTDFEQMKNLARLSTDNMQNYWLASRFVDEYSSRVNFKMRFIYDIGICYDYDLWGVDESGAYGSISSKLLRPVVTLKSDISFSGSGTAEDPYTF